MRWFWIDRFLEFESGRRATAVKNVSLAEEHLHDHFSGQPVMPNSLVIEGLAQTGGLLVAQHFDFDSRIVLAKVTRALRYEATIEDVNQDGAIVSGRALVDQRQQAEVDLFFANLGERYAGKSLFEPHDFLALLKLLGIFDVGRNPDGSPLQIPPDLVQAEHDFNTGVTI
jgi:3-hydroxyacyl-[acyl-carrier-protein] dehydratase